MTQFYMMVRVNDLCGEELLRQTSRSVLDICLLKGFQDNIVQFFANKIRDAPGGFLEGEWVY